MDAAETTQANAARRPGARHKIKVSAMGMRSAIHPARKRGSSQGPGEALQGERILDLQEDRSGPGYLVARNGALSRAFDSPPTPAERLQSRSDRRWRSRGLSGVYGQWF